MLSMLLLPLMVLAILAADQASRGTVRLYLRAQLLNTLVGLPVFYLLGAHAKWYLAATIVCTGPILMLCVFMLRESCLTRDSAYKAFIFALAMSVFGVMGFVYHEPGELYDVAMAGIEALLGMAMLLTAEKRPVTFQTLGTAYLALSVFYFGYVRHWPAWDRTASWLPTLIGIASFGWIWLKGGDFSLAKSQSGI